MNQEELLKNIMAKIVSSKNNLFEEFRDKYKGLSVQELNVHYRAEYQATQDVLMKCLQTLAAELHNIKNLNK